MWKSSSSSSSSSSTSSLSPYNTTTNPTQQLLPKTMEEVWKDITFAATDDDLPPHHLHSSSVILQDFFSRTPPNSSSPPPPPPPLLTLNSVPQNFSSLFLHNHHPISHHDNAGRDRNKRLAEVDKSSGDRRHKRMIKNRESAARSRARKQAYTSELELEVAHLLEENAQLKKKHEQFCIAAAAAQHQKKWSLNRATTAPF